MNKIKIAWMILALLFLLNALDALVFGIMNPVANPTLQTFADKVIRAFISILLAAGILFYVQIKQR